MTGFLDAGAAGAVGTTVAALVTLGVWSYLAGERRLFAWAQHLLAGLATGYLIVLAVREVLVPSLVEPLLTAPLGNAVLWPGLVLVVLLVGARWLPPSFGAVPVAVLVAATAAFALGGAVVGTLLPQLAAGLVPGAVAPLSLANVAVGIVISVLVLITFLHGTRPSRAGGAAARVGRWVLVAGIGGWLGFLVVSRLALLVDRLRFLLVDWLGIGR